MENNYSKHMLACMICGILTFCGVVASIISLIKGSNGIWVADDVANLVVVALLGYYAFSGYRKPHGNLLKYIILLFAVTRIIAIYQFVGLGLVWQAIIDTIIVGLSCYVAGRLHRAKQNKIFMIIITILMLIEKVIGFMYGRTIITIGAVTPFIIWIDICVAYFLRYKEHKEAGLMDAEKK